MKNYFDFTGYTAVVTGASTGLGLQMAKAYASQGANLVLIARREELLKENAKAITEEFGVEVLPYMCATQIAAIVDEVREVTREQLGVKPIAVDGLRNAEWVANLAAFFKKYNAKRKLFLLNSFPLVL